MKKTILAATIAMGAAFSPIASALNICTGNEGGGYERLGKAIAGNLKTKASIINTNGSLENIELFDSKECDIAIVQNDALAVTPPSRPFKSKSAHEEVVYWFYNKKNGFEDLEDVEGKEKDYRIVIIQDSGSDVTMQNFVKEDSGYAGLYNTAILAEDAYDAADIASEGVYQTGDGKQVKVAGFIYVTRPGAFSNDIVTDFKGKLAIGELTDGDFNDAEAFGERLYRSCDLSSDYTKGMPKASWGSQSTICMDAKVIYAKDLKDRSVKKAINRAVR